MSQKIDQVTLYRARLQQSMAKMTEDLANLIDSVVDLESLLECQKQGCLKHPHDKGEEHGRCFP